MRIGLGGLNSYHGINDGVPFALSKGTGIGDRRNLTDLFTANIARTNPSRFYVSCIEEISETQGVEMSETGSGRNCYERAKDTISDYNLIGKMGQNPLFHSGHPILGQPPRRLTRFKPPGLALRIKVRRIRKYRPLQHRRYKYPDPSHPQAMA